MTTENMDQDGLKAKIIPFLFEEWACVRVIDLSGAPWFVVPDICSILGTQNPTQAGSSLDDDERAMLNIGRQGEVNIISEGGLYTLVLRSRDATKPGTVAHRFRKWVTAEVLPAIRQTGRYVPPSPAPIARKPYDQWDLEEERVAVATVSLARKVFNNGVAAWMWHRRGMPDIPEQLLPLWARQPGIFDGPTIVSTSTTVVSTGGRA